MAFTPDTLSLVVDSIGGGAVSIWSYRTADDEATVLAPDYMIGATRYRVRDGDVVLVYGTAVSDVYLARVVSINAAGDASLQIDMGILAEFERNASVEAASVSPIIKALRTQGYYEAGDGGGTLYKGVDVEPSHGLKIQSEDGRWWARPITPFTIFEAGAKGDGVTDDTAAFQIAANAPHPWCYVPDGEYSVDTVTVREPRKRFELGNKARVTMRSSFEGFRAVFDFAATAAGSSFKGGIIDGNRDVLRDAYNNPNWLWTGLRALNVNDFTLEDTLFENVVANGWWVQGRRIFVRNIRVKNSGKGSHVKSCYDSVFIGLTFDDIGNDGLDVYQHCCPWRNSYNCLFSNITIRDFNPDGTAREPTPNAIALERLIGCKLSDVAIEGFVGSSQSGFNIACSAHTCRDLVVDGLTSRGYTRGLLLASCDGVAVANYDLDGQYVASVDRGILLTNGGIIESETGALDTNGRTPLGSRGVRFSNGRVRRFNVGAEVRGDRVSFSNTQIYGNLSDGIQTTRPPTNGFFGGTSPVVGSRVDLDATVSVFNNGRVGVFLDQYDDVRINGARIENNGQNTALADTQRIGVGAFSASGTQRRAQVQNCRLGDTQTFTLTDAASFVPGATDANNRKQLYFNNVNGIDEGQWVTLEGAAGSGVDIVAKVVDIDVINFVVTVETAGAETFSETGNIANLTGTFSTTGSQLTGAGSALLSEGKPFAILKANGEYRILRRVDSDTEAWLQEAFSVDLSGATVQIILIDVSGIPSQHYGERWPNGLAAATVLTRWNSYDGVITAPMNIPTVDRSLFAPGAEPIFTTAVAGANVSTSSATSPLISNIPDGWVPLSYRAIITEEITGTDATALNWEFRDTTGVRKAAAVSTAYVVGTKVRGDVTSDPLVGAGNFALRLTGGSDQIASGGRVRADVVCRVPRLKPFD